MRTFITWFPPFLTLPEDTAAAAAAAEAARVAEPPTPAAAAELGSAEERIEVSLLAR